VPQTIRPLVMAEEAFLKAYMDAGAAAVKELIEEWRRRKKIRVGIMAVLQLHGRAGNSNPYLDPGEGRGLRMEPGRRVA
jgi:hypothetical protein